MTNETNDQRTRDAAAILAELMGAVDALAESWRGEADTYRDRRQFAAADAIGTAALQASDTVAALRTRVAAGQTRQAPRESTIVPVNDSGELECSCGSNQIQELGQFWSALARQDGRTTLADGTLIATVRNNATRRRMADRLTSRDRDVDYV